MSMRLLKIIVVLFFIGRVLCQEDKINWDKVEIQDLTRELKLRKGDINEKGVKLNEGLKKFDGKKIYDFIIAKLTKYTREELIKELKGRLKSGEKSILSQFDSVDSKMLYQALIAKDEAIYNPKSIYDVDDRKDYYEVGPEIKEIMDSSVSLFLADKIQENDDETSTLLTQTFGDAKDLCDDERFRNQPLGAFCSGFLVAPDIIATAAHCIFNRMIVDNAGNANIHKIRFVFGFHMDNEGKAFTVVKKTEIYNAVSIIGHELDPNGSDWALVRIHKPVTNHKVVKVRTEGKVEDNSSVYIIGYPCGIPAKYAGNANVLDNTPISFFVSNLDSFGGNSGSMVVNSTTNIVEGILVRGAPDFFRTYENGRYCNRSSVYPTTGGRGEDCTRTTEFASLLSSSKIFSINVILQARKLTADNLKVYAKRIKMSINGKKIEKDLNFSRCDGINIYDWICVGSSAKSCEILKDPSYKLYIINVLIETSNTSLSQEAIQLYIDRIKKAIESNEEIPAISNPDDSDSKFHIYISSSLSD